MYYAFIVLYTFSFSFLLFYKDNIYNPLQILYKWLKVDN